MFKKFNAIFLMIISATSCLMLSFFNSEVVLRDGFKSMRIYSVKGSVNDGVAVDKNFRISVKEGESYILDCDTLDVTEFFGKVGGEILFSENVENGVSYYGYSPKIKYKEKINGKTVNIHLFVKEDFAKVGFPLIYGGY